MWSSELIKLKKTKKGEEDETLTVHKDNTFSFFFFLSFYQAHKNSWGTFTNNSLGWAWCQPISMFPRIWSDSSRSSRWDLLASLLLVRKTADVPPLGCSFAVCQWKWCAWAMKGRLKVKIVTVATVPSVHCVVHCAKECAWRNVEGTRQV